MIESIFRKIRISWFPVILGIYNCNVTLNADRFQSSFHIVAKPFAVTILFLVCKIGRKWFQSTNSQLYTYIPEVFLEILINAGYFFFIGSCAFDQVIKELLAVIR